MSFGVVMGANKEFIYLSLGSNLGDSRQNIDRAIELLSGKVSVLDIAPLFYNPAMLLPGKTFETNPPFYNTVIKCVTDLEPLQLLFFIKQIESEMGRNLEESWEPRVIDIDILLYGDRRVSAVELSIPHIGVLNRACVLDPLAYISPELCIDGKSILDLSRKHCKHLPVIMGILNLTPDSFSGDGKLNDLKLAESTIVDWIKKGIGIIDIGMESTRPSATRLNGEEEIARLKAVMPVISQFTGLSSVRFSIDTYRSDTAQFALDNGFKIVNDVSGISDKRMLQLGKEYNCEIIAMHSFNLPEDRGVSFDFDQDIIGLVSEFFESKIQECVDADFPLSRLVLDPGIGFGKVAHQSLQVLQRFDELHNTSVPIRLLAGHSRKSFISYFTDNPVPDRDLETIAISLYMRNCGADILRVHDPIGHCRALTAALYMCK